MVVTERLKDAKQAKEYREYLLEQQGNCDQIIVKPITNAVLDHQHFAPYRCRAVLQNECNAFEGKVYNAYRRYLKHLTKDSLSNILRNLAWYLEQDYSNSPKHHTAIKSELRGFKKASAGKQKEVLTKLNIEPKETAAKRFRQMRTAVLGGVISIEKLEILLR